MCHRVIAIALLTTVLLGAGCFAYTSTLQSPFFTKFSVRELVEKNEFNAGLDCSTTGTSGGGGMSVGTGGVGKDGSQFSKLDSIACQITDVGLFDEAKFIEALKESVLKDLQTYKATVLGNKNPDVSGFNLAYGLTDQTGTIKVTATKGPDRYYTLEANLNEKSKHAQ